METLLEVRNLKTYFYTEEGVVRSVDGVDFAIKKGRTLGVLGESGCGKSVTSLSVMQIVPRPGKIVDGQILFYQQGKAQDIAKLEPSGKEMLSLRGSEIAMIFQEPMTTFDPLYTVGFQIMEGVIQHQRVSKQEARKIAIDALKKVGMPQPEQTVDRYPHQLSGGMRQRAVIAMALANNPKLLIADEPTTALDVTTEAQILELLEDLKQREHMTMMYITHNLGVIAEVADDVIVMYLGKVVERCDITSLFDNPKHPYTQALLNSIPKLGHKKEQETLEAIKGMVPSIYNMPTGCTFHPRCKAFMPGVCDLSEPPEFDLGNGHFAKCFLYDDPAKTKPLEASHDVINRGEA